MNFYPLFAQVEQSSTQSLVDKLARTPESTIVAIVIVLTVIRLGIYLATRSKLVAYTTEGAAPVEQSIKRSAGRKPSGLSSVQTSAMAGVSFILEMCDALVYAGIFVFLLARPYLVQAFVIPSGSMVSTLDVGDYILANKFVYRFSDPKDGDIVVFVPPRTAVAGSPSEQDANGDPDVDFIKRCIGCPGDTIEIRDDVLYRNGKPVKEDYRHFTMQLDRNGTQFKEIRPSDDAMHPRNFKLVYYDGKYWPLTISGDLANANPTYTAAKYQVQSLDLMRNLLAQPPAKIPDGMYLMMGDNRNYSYDGRAWGLVPRKNIIARADYRWWPITRISRLHSDPGKIEAN